MSRTGQTPWQTVGPFFHNALPWKGCADLTRSGSDLGARLDLVPEGRYCLAEHPDGPALPCEVIEITGTVTDADGAPVADALIELWQAGEDGIYASPDDPGFDARTGGFIGFGRCATDEGGVYRFRTVRPGRAPDRDGRLQAPHIALGILGRGILKRLATRLYFADDPSNIDDPVLALVPEHRRNTLMAQREGEVWRLDIRLSGPDETVFFDL